MADHPNDSLVIYGYSQGAAVANVEKPKLAEQYPKGTEAPDIDFVLGGDPNLPNGGLLARVPGLHIPILDWSFNGPAPTDTQFKTVEINRQYDGFADFPLYPLNLVADLNAVLGLIFVHFYPFDVSLPADPTKSPAYQGHYGDTDYYFFESEDLPLFAPLRIAGVPEPVIDVFEPFVREVVELGYDRDIKPWEPTPARLIPMHDPATVATDLVNAVGEGIDNALALTGSPLTIPAPDTSTVTTFRVPEANDGSVVGSPGRLVDVNAIGDDISHSLSARNPFRTDQGNKQVETDDSGSPTLLPGLTKLTPKSLTDGFRFTPAKPGSAKGDHPTGGPAAKVGANVSDTLQQVANNVGKTVQKDQKATDRVSQRLSGLNGGHKVDRKADGAA